MTSPIDAYVAEAMAEFIKAGSATTSHEAAIAATPVKPSSPVEEKPIAPKEKKVKLAKDEQLYSTLFRYTPTRGDFGVPFYVPDAVMGGFVPKADPSYVVQQEEAARLVAAIVDGDKVLMTGPTGSGKSSLVKYVCAKLGLPFIRVNMSADVESSQLFGTLVLRDGATVFEDGPITDAVRNGAVLLIDEWELMPPEISMGLQNLLEDGGYLFLKEMPGTSEEKTLYPHPNFRIICAGNTLGQGDDSGGFAGTFVQNTATLDRFTCTIHLSYLSEEHEVSILSNHGVTKKDAKLMVKLASLIRDAHKQQQINLTMSPRTLINWARKAARYDDVQYGLVVAFMDKLRDHDKALVKEFVGKVYGKM
jgi:cobaltochelatase CobS